MNKIYFLYTLGLLIVNGTEFQIVKLLVKKHTRYIGRKDVFMKDDEVFDKLIYQILVLNLIFVIRNWYQGRSKANGKIVRIHHVFVTVIKTRFKLDLLSVYKLL